jgi:transposase, IS30 family
MDIYFCDPPHRGSEGLTKTRTDCCASISPRALTCPCTPERLLEATELNARPRKTLGGITPAQAMQRLLFDPEVPIVVTTA